ncbi:hypothetical protein TYRP_008261 [Tyrophagus putrescentiae]|nr:hypothetical protein TYRP_008261 [Tyrophagus putrescentiae]
MKVRMLTDIENCTKDNINETSKDVEEAVSADLEEGSGSESTQKGFRRNRGGGVDCSFGFDQNAPTN